MSTIVPDQSPVQHHPLICPTCGLHDPEPALHVTETRFVSAVCKCPNGHAYLYEWQADN